MAFSALQEIIEYASEHRQAFWEAVLADDMAERKVSREESLLQMKGIWDAILHASRHYEKDRKSASTLVGGQGALMEAYCANNTPLSGDFSGRAQPDTGQCRYLPER